MTVPSSHPQLLQGVRVLDVTRVLAGPYCTMILADLGAEVVKIEHPVRGDDSRGFGPFLPGGLSAYYASINRGKKSVSLDLKAATDRSQFLQLVECADVLVENFRAGTMRSFGLSAEDLRPLNPRLVYASLSGFGQSGPDVNRAAYDIVIQALSGLMSITGDGPGHTVRVGTSISDILTGMFGAIAVVAALHHRDVTGEGTVVDLAMLDCTVAALENAISRFAVTGRSPGPMGTRHPSITPFQAFATADGPLVVAAGNDALWRKLCKVLNCPELASDARLATNGDRTVNSDFMEQCLSPRFREHTREYWLEKFNEAGIPAAPIRDIAQVVADSHLAARGLFHTMEDAQGGEFVTAGSPFRMNGATPPLARTAPRLGEHTQSVLDEWLGPS